MLRILDVIHIDDRRMIVAVDDTPIVVFVVELINAKLNPLFLKQIIFEIGLNRSIEHFLYFLLNWVFLKLVSLNIILLT